MIQVLNVLALGAWFRWAGVWQRSSPLGKVAPLVKSNYRLTDDFSAALLPLNSLKPKEGSTHLPRARGGLTKSGAPSFPEN